MIGIKLAKEQCFQIMILLAPSESYCKKTFTHHESVDLRPLPHQGLGRLLGLLLEHGLEVPGGVQGGHGLLLDGGPGGGALVVDAVLTGLLHLPLLELGTQLRSLFSALWRTAAM